MALDRLKELEKRHRQIHSFNKPKGFFQDLLLIWKQTTDVTTPNEDVLNEYQEATLLLKESAATFENNDALLLLAELNLVRRKRKDTFLKKKLIVFCSFQSMHTQGIISKPSCIIMN